ncbi:hypothetical protein EB796_021088 [Bugula neritina]|uniref:Uncharacterized protein n=1 Tax=Bugula neritina TaxID=10212 RepID=A0A7J7J5B7_BUGNE|nr:hypothetical protein EB796_021088 [Bugula neritina]
MNFVTSGRRARTQSATLTAPAHKATPTPPEVLSPDISVDSFQQANVMSTNSLASSMPSSLPLSASHDSAQIKDELSVADRQRSSSFTGKSGNRTRRENAVPLFTTDHRSAVPWPKRTFPLNDKEVEGLSSKPRLPKKSWENFSAQQWKVINPEQTLEEKSSLVLKLSKT